MTLSQEIVALREARTEQFIREENVTDGCGYAVKPTPAALIRE